MTTAAPWAKKEGTPSTEPTGQDLTPPSAPVQHDHVMVGCKLPNGILLELIPKHEGWNPPPTGPRVKINGSNSVRRDSMIVRVNPRILDYGQTLVNRSFWEQWLEQNKDKALVTSGAIFAESTRQDFVAHAKDTLGEKVGLEGLNPEGNDDRLKKIQLAGHPETKVETDKEHLERLRKNMDQVA